MRFLLPVFLLVTSTAAAQPRIAMPYVAGALGGVPSGTPSAEPLALTIVDAVTRGLQHNLAILTATDTRDMARGARWTALAELLPDVSGHVRESRQVVNLAAFGFPRPAGVPSIVGPFNVFDARVTVSQAVVDLKAINTARAERHRLMAAEHDVRTARDLVVLVGSGLYLQALAASARTEAAAAQLQTADATFRQASDMKAGGLVAGIDVLRAEVQLATARQRATAARNEFEKTKLQLARVIGLPVGQAFRLVDDLPFSPVPDLTLEAALEQGYTSRPDYMAALERVRAAEAARRAAASEWLPSLEVNADYGALGLTPADAHGTYSVVGALKVPIFNGGRTRARMIEAEAELRRRRSEAEDLRASIDYDVRTAFLDLQASREQLDVATRARDLSNQQLMQARDRFAAGVASNLEVVQAQEAVATASEQHIAALYGYNLAKELLARGIGHAERLGLQFLGGSR